MPYIDSFNVGNVAYDIRDKYAGLYTANAYSNSATYAVGDLVTYDGKLYECNTPIPTAEAWTPAHWTETTIAEETVALKSEVAQLENASSIINTIENATIATFKDGTNNHIIALLINIAANQRGTQDPAPTNIRPILGWNSVEIGLTKNVPIVIDGVAQGSLDPDSGTTISQARRVRTGFIKVNPNTEYTIYTNFPFVALYEYSTDSSTGFIQRRGDFNTNPKTWTTTATTEYVKILLGNSPSQNSGVNTYPYELEYLWVIETATENNIYNVPFQTDAGTIYGGTVDIINGTLSVNTLFVTLTGEETNWSNLTTETDPTNYYRLKIGNSGFIETATENVRCSHFPFNPNILGSNTQQGYRAYSSSNSSIGSVIVIRPDLTEYPTLSAFKTFLQEQYANNTPVQCTVILSNPVTYQIAPTIIKTLTGNNYLLANTGIIDELQYYANNKIYINEKDDVIKALIAPVLNSMIADTALVENDFRIVGNTLYRITTSVASGATLTPNTNCTATTVADVLKSLLS